MHNIQEFVAILSNKEGRELICETFAILYHGVYVQMMEQPIENVCCRKWLCTSTIVLNVNVLTVAIANRNHMFTILLHQVTKKQLIDRL